jgi:hypothetical protein
MKPFASVSLDLDNQWSYMKIHGDTGWNAYPSYFGIFVPHALDALDRAGLKITFFIVGRDTESEQNRPYLQEITRRGHEVGNHSYGHESWLQRYSAGQLQKEIADAHDAIGRVTGKEPVGFRGPGFSWTPALLEILADAGYLFDASTLPTYLGPLARMYYFATSGLSRQEKRERGELFGGFRDGLRPIQPYHWLLGSGRTLLEIPVTTVPFIKTPFHLSYLLWLSRFSPLLMILYLSCAIQLCRACGVSPSFLLHPLDLLGGDKLSSLSFFPGMDLTSEAKSAVFAKVIRVLSRHYELVAMSTHARRLESAASLKIMDAHGHFQPARSRPR